MNGKIIKQCNDSARKVRGGVIIIHTWKGAYKAGMRSDFLREPGMPDLNPVHGRRCDPPPASSFEWGIVLPSFISTNRPCLCVSGSVDIGVLGEMGS